jgi:hypothetical protein
MVEFMFFILIAIGAIGLIGLLASLFIGPTDMDEN